VTGAAHGIGLAIARRLATSGWAVVGVDRDASALAESMPGLRGTAVPGDVRDPAVLAAARDAAEGLGELRAWVNNAGVVRVAPLHLMEPETIDEVLDIDLRAVLLGTREALGSFLRHGIPGAVVNISSIHARAGFPGYGAYDAAKGGVEALTRHVCVEYGHLGIRCNAVAPGAVRTDIAAPERAGPGSPALRTLQASALAPMRRVSEPEEIAEAVAFLVEGPSGAVNGHVLAVDNGMSSWSFAFDPDPAVAFGRQAGP
jgi:glucose 1-dehydrogenase